MADDAPGPRVVSLRGGEIIPPGVPKPRVIALAEEVLERARSGELSSLSVILGHSDEAFSYRHEGPVVFATIGALERLKATFISDA